jgi:threonine dehydratase
MTLRHDPIALEDIRAAQDRIRNDVVRTPLIRLSFDEAPAEIYLKLETLQPIGSFKLRGASNAIRLADPDRMRVGVWTISAGNAGQGVAWSARRIGAPCTVVVPEIAAQTKLDAMERLGARIVKVSFDEWQRIGMTRAHEGLDGLFVHPFSDEAFMAGNGTIGLEILEDLPDVDAILVPYGGGGLSCGIASAIHAVAPRVKIYACEYAPSAPLEASLAAGHPVEVPYTPTFVDGIGGPIVFPEMFDLAARLLDGSIVVGLDDVADAVRLLAERTRVIAEGAGAASVTAALTGKADGSKVVCIVSGGNIDSTKLAAILQGETPEA